MIKERMMFMKDLIYHDKLLSRPRLFWATLYLNYACNFRCRHCYGKYGENYGSHFQTDSALSLDQAKQIIDKLRLHGCRYIAFLGGEPLLHPQLKPIIEYIRAQNMEISIVTNGSLVKQKLPDLRGVSTLCFSIDGAEESNNFLRGKGSYARTLQAVEFIQNNTDINTHISACLYSKSARDMDDLFEFSRCRNCYLGFCPLMYQSYADENEAYLRPADADCRAFYRRVLDLKAKNYPIMYSPLAYQTLLRWPDYDHPVLWNDEPQSPDDLGFPPCRAGKNFLYIGASGDVYPCSQLVGVKQFTPKNIFRDGFESAWLHASQIPCKACSNIGFLDINLMISLRWKSLAAMARQSWREYRFTCRKTG